LIEDILSAVKPELFEKVEIGFGAVTEQSQLPIDTEPLSKTFSFGIEVSRLVSGGLKHIIEYDTEDHSGRFIGTHSVSCGETPEGFCFESLLDHLIEEPGFSHAVLSDDDDGLSVGGSIGEAIRPLFQFLLSSDERVSNLRHYNERF
jgi:hypothetical protein